METGRTEETAVREYLKRNKVISIPMLQTEFKISYSTAKQMMSAIIARVWATEQAEGVYYKVIYDNMIERNLSVKQIEKLCKILTADCLRVVSYLTANGHGDYSDLLEAVQGENDTRAAIEILTDEKVIHEVNGIFYPSISEQSIMMLNRMARKKSDRSGMAGDDRSDLQADLEKKFNELFGDLKNDEDDDDDDE